MAEKSKATCRHMRKYASLLEAVSEAPFTTFPPRADLGESIFVDLARYRAKIAAEVVGGKRGCPLYFLC